MGYAAKPTTQNRHTGVDFVYIPSILWYYVTRVTTVVARLNF